ncbi:hypothetical protein QQP08_020655 [Theobroma cacao]|nr:hypothetical protein QQP08_020655 [Theobroma cacao]
MPNELGSNPSGSCKFHFQISFIFVATASQHLRKRKETWLLSLDFAVGQDKPFPQVFYHNLLSTSIIILKFTI